MGFQIGLRFAYLVSSQSALHANAPPSLLPPQGQLLEVEALMLERLGRYREAIGRLVKVWGMNMLLVGCMRYHDVVELILPMGEACGFVRRFHSTPESAFSLGECLHSTPPSPAPAPALPRAWVTSPWQRRSVTGSMRRNSRWGLREGGGQRDVRGVTATLAPGACESPLHDLPRGAAVGRVGPFRPQRTFPEAAGFMSL